MSPLEALARELGLVAARIEREATLRVDAATAEMRRIGAEVELRLARIEAAVTDRLASLQDGAPGADGKSITADDVQPMIGQEVQRAMAAAAGTLPAHIDAAVAAAVASLPPAPAGKDADMVAIEQRIADIAAAAASEVKATAEAAAKAIEQATTDVRAAIDAIPEPVPGPPGPPGKSFGEEGELEIIKGLLSDLVEKAHADLAKSMAEQVSASVAAIPVPRDGKDADPDAIREMVAEAVAAIPAPKDGRDGVDGKDGRLPVVKAWEDRVHYAGEVVAFEGATYQATRDTGRAPGGDDWCCIAARGEPGADGETFTICGTFDPQGAYRRLSVVMLGGASFVAKRDNPGECPGDGWQLMSQQGKRGIPGQSTRGEPGPAAIALDVDDEGLLTLTNADGSRVSCDLYPILSKL